MQNVLAVILAGGKGSRLEPLTEIAANRRSRLEVVFELLTLPFPTASTAV